MREDAPGRYGVGALLGTLLALGLLGPGGPVGASGEDVPAVVALLLDTSGSIRPADLARIRTLAVGVLEKLPPGSQVAVYTFDDAPRLVLPRTSDVEAVRKAVLGIRIAGKYTALNDALYDASRYLGEVPPARKAIVLVTDGQDENSALNLEDSLAVAEATGIPVFAVGVGRVQERVLRRIAKLTAGQYVAGAEASGATLASWILAVPPAPQGPAAPPLAPVSPAAGPGVRPGTGGPEAAERPRRVLLWTGGAAAVLALAAFAFLAAKGKGSPRCKTCGRPLLSASSPCATCSTDEDADPGGRTPPPDGDVSETVVARLNTTEEYLEKTVTLRERAVLAITRGPGTGKVFDLSSRSATSLGRARANDIVLEDVAISSQHCRIRPEDGHFVLHDMKSTNGTFLNDRRVERTPLSEGDVIKIGETCLQFRMEQKRDGAPSPPGTSRGGP